jgi:flavin-dependent dehydrogenase
VPDLNGSCDVAIIGGGPAGSTAATLLSRAGRRVVLLEKAQHPRFHIGESLLPMNLPLFERLGVLDKVAAMGVHKAGADFEADNERGYKTFEFHRALGDSPPHAYQVWREDFDQMLFEHARAAGTDARCGHEVVEAEQIGPRRTDLKVRAAAGEYRLTARFIIDASGRDTFLAGKRRLRRKNHEHQSAAMFGHFTGALRREGDDAGNISIYRFEYGWMWMIPLPGGLMSVGAVCRPEYLKRRRGRSVEFLRETLEQNAQLKARLTGATLVGDIVHFSGNYSYDCAHMGGPGWILVGDAFAFLDPVFSSGVFLAMHGAEEAAHLIDTALDHPHLERKLLKHMERRQRAGMRRFAFFIYRFNNPIMRRLFNKPRNNWQIEQGVISMLAGDLFDSPKVLRRLKAFRFIYAVVALTHFADWRAEDRYRRSQARVAIDAETGGG